MIDLVRTVKSILRISEYAEKDICGLCGLPNADKIPHPAHWPGEKVPSSQYIHAACEEEECLRAHSALTDKQRKAFLRTL